MDSWRLVSAGALTALVLSLAHAYPEAGWLLGAVALYSRVEREGQFENDTRRKIFDHVRVSPGESISQIATVIGVSHSTASYHLDRLVDFNLLTPTPDGNKVRFFINGGIFTEEDRRALAALANAETRRVLATILSNPGSYRAELTSILSVSSPTVNWHLTRLLAAGLVEEQQRGRNRYLFSDPVRLGRLMRELVDKVENTTYDHIGLVDLKKLCGVN